MPSDIEAALPTSRTPLLPRASTSDIRQSPRRGSRATPAPSIATNTPGTSRHRRRAPPVHYLPAAFALFLFVLATVAAWDISVGACALPWLCRLLGGVQEPLDAVWARNTGAYAPWRSRAAVPASLAGLPRGCAVDQVTILHRHTGRYPTLRAGDLLRETLAKIDNRGVRVPAPRTDWAFLSSADFALQAWAMGELTDQGRRAAWESGKTYAERYARLDVDNVLFSRASGAERVQETARFWLEAWAGREYNRSAEGDTMVFPDVVIPEGEHVNNTLSVHSCPRFNALSPPDGALEAATIARRLLLPAVSRLNRALAPSPPLELDDVLRLASMCGFDSSATGAGDGDSWGGWSRWCRVLKRDEWEAAGYVADVERWYRVGEGSRFGKIMGAGWVNELLARLTDSIPEDETCTNRTLDGDEATFPPGGRRVFVDFTHDNEMIEILTALGVRKMRRKLPINHLPGAGEGHTGTTRRFILSELIPFGARWAFERVQCPVPDDVDLVIQHGKKKGSGGGDGGKTTRRPFVRVLVNDRPMHVDHMACRSSRFYAHHMCDMEAFIESQAWSTDDVDWDDCRVRHK